MSGEVASELEGLPPSEELAEDASSGEESGDFVDIVARLWYEDERDEEAEDSAVVYSRTYILFSIP